MPTLIRLEAEGFHEATDALVIVAAEDAIPVEGGVILPLARSEAEGAALLDEGRKVGVRIEPNEAVEELGEDLKRLSVVALAFPKYLQGQAYSSAAILRERGFAGEVRAVGDVLREQARFMVRCGFDAFEPADDASSQEWTHAVTRFRHVYQRAADHVAPAFEERQA